MRTREDSAEKASRAFWDRYQDENAHRNADAALKGDMPHDQRERLLAIWHWVVMVEEGERVDRIHLSQQARIANARNKRVRGVGAAAKRAGFAG